MVCYHPIKGWRSSKVNNTGTRSITFNRKDALIDRPVTISCGQCVGCRLERSRQWAIRCLHEASLNKENCFITLTYNDEHLPADGSLDIRHFQKFMKRLRKKYTGRKIRFFHCGEYGSSLGRPHYHACLFGIDFEDKKLWQVRNENRLYRSKILEELWPFGFSSVGDVTFDSAAYVARYIMKKVTGDLALEHYVKVDDETGEIFEIMPEYTTMSRRPGLGADWIKKYPGDVYPGDFVVVRGGKKSRPPRFYDKTFELTEPKVLRTVKARRRTAGEKHPEEKRPDRLRVRERCQKEKLKRLVRELE